MTMFVTMMNERRRCEWHHPWWKNPPLLVDGVTVVFSIRIPPVTVVIIIV